MGENICPPKGRHILTLSYRISPVWFLAFHSLFAVSGGEANVLLPRPQARRCTSRRIEQQQQPQQQQHQHQHQYKQHASGFLVSPSPTVLQRGSKIGSSRRPLPSSLLTLSARRALASVRQQSRRLSLFQIDPRLWLLPTSTQQQQGYRSTTTDMQTVHGHTTRTLRGGGSSGGSSGGGSAVRGATGSLSQQRNFAGLSATATATPTATGVEIVKPERDERSYRYLVLPNGLAVVVVSDPLTETAAASMLIRCGHMQDPEELAGMAHFHEHSEK